MFQTASVNEAAVPLHGAYAEELRQAYGPEPPPAAKADQKTGQAAETAAKEAEDKNANTQGAATTTSSVVEFEKTPRFKELVEQIRNASIAAEILASINFKDLQNSLLEIMKLFISKTNTRKGADDSIICNAMALESVVLIENPKLVDDFYAWQPGTIEENAPIKNINDLLLNGIYSNKASIIRTAFKDNLELIAEKVTTNTGVLPLYYLIKMLKENMPSPEMTIDTKDSAQFFKLLGALILQY